MRGEGFWFFAELGNIGLCKALLKKGKLILAACVSGPQFGSGVTLARAERLFFLMPDSKVGMSYRTILS